MPLSCSVPLEQSRFCDVAKHIKSHAREQGAHRGRALVLRTAAPSPTTTPRCWSRRRRRAALDSRHHHGGQPLRAEHVAALHALGARRARHAHARGGGARGRPGPLACALRVRNHAARPKHDDADPSLKTPRGEAHRTFTAQERLEAEAGRRGRGRRAPVESLSCKRRSLERAREKELLESRWTLSRACERVKRVTRVRECQRRLARAKCAFLHLVRVRTCAQKKVNRVGCRRRR